MDLFLDLVFLDVYHDSIHEDKYYSKLKHISVNITIAAIYLKVST